MVGKLWHCDLETGGLNPRTSAIVQVACIMEIDGEKVGRFSSLVRPFPGLECTDEALAISGIQRADLEGAPDEKRVFSEMFAWLSAYVSKFDKADKAIFTGYNSQFDDGFVRAACDRHGEKYLGSWKWPDVYDVRGAAALYCLPYRHWLPDFQLGTVSEFLLRDYDSPEMIATTVARALGIPGTGLHDARVDIELSRLLFHKVRQPFQFRISREELERRLEHVREFKEAKGGQK